MIKVEVNKKDYRRIMRSLRRIKMRAHKWIVADGGEINRRCAIKFAQLMVRNILTGKYAGGYPKYNARYKRWKQAYAAQGFAHFGMGFWTLGGDLVRNLVHFKEGRGWMGGVPGHVMDRGGKSWLGYGDKGPPKRIAMYGGIAEKRRPVFEPSMNEFASIEWQKEGDIALQEVTKDWGRWRGTRRGISVPRYSS